jgi:hypothetical protein
MKSLKDIEIYVVIFLFLVVIFISVFGNEAKISSYQTMDTSLSPYPYQEGFRDDDDDEEEREGMQGMGSDLNTTPIYDPISKLEGKSSCAGNSPYSNSLGGLCISSEAKLAITTRGNNSTSNSIY